MDQFHLVNLDFFRSTLGIDVALSQNFSFPCRVKIDKDSEYARCGRSFIFHCLRVLKSVCDLESNIKIKLSRFEATAMLGMNKLNTISVLALIIDKSYT